MGKFLDLNGVSYLWNKIKTKYDGNIGKLMNQVFPWSLSVSPNGTKYAEKGGPALNISVDYSAKEFSGAAISTAKYTVTLNGQVQQNPANPFQVKSVTTDTSITITATYNGSTKTGQLVQKFVNPVIAAVVDGNFTVNADNVKALAANAQNKMIVGGKANKRQYVHTNYNKSLYAYPASYGDLTKVLYEENSNQDVMSLFTKSKVSITFKEGNTEDYLVYLSNNAVNGTFTYNFN